MTDWKAYLRMLRKKLWLVALIVLVFTAGTAYYSINVAKPLYKATTKLFIVIYRPDETNRLYYDDLLASQVLVANVQELIKSRSITSEVINSLQLEELNHETLIELIDVDLIPNTSIINVTVKYDDPDEVANIANQLSTVFIRRLTDLTHTNYASMVDRATVSETPVYPHTQLFIVFGFIIGIILSLGMILILVYFDDSIGDLDDIQEKTGLPVVGIIPDINKIGSRKWIDI